MFKKLLKYEFAALGRVLLPAYALTVFVSALIRVSVEINSFLENLHTDAVRVLSGLGTAFSAAVIMAGVLVFAGAALITFGMIIYRFYKNLLCDEGYLMHTLPVKSVQLLLCKLAAACICLAAAAAVGFIDILIISGFKSVELISELYTYDMLLYIFRAVTHTLYSLLLFYASMSVGQLANKYKKLLAFGVFIGANTLISSVTTAIKVVFALLLDDTFFSDTFLNAYSFVLCFDAVVYIAAAAALFLITNNILDKRLNLE